MSAASELSLSGKALDNHFLPPTFLFSKCSIITTYGFYKAISDNNIF